MPVRKTYFSDIREKAEKAKEKKAAFGPDIDLSRYAQHVERGKIESLESLSMQAKEAAILTGISLEEKERAGSYMQVDQSVVYESLNKAYEGQLEIMSTTDALNRYDWLEDYFWKSVPVDQDKFTAQAALNMTHGYFIRVFPIKNAIPCSVMPVGCRKLYQSERTQYYHRRGGCRTSGNNRLHAFEK